MTITTTSVNELLHARYGANSLPAPALKAAETGVWNEVVASILGHRSIRNYQETPLPAGTLELLVAAAQSAASSSNLQTWSVVAVSDADRKARLATLAGEQAHIQQAPLFLVWLVDLSRLGRAASARSLPHGALDYFEMFLVGAIDAALAAQNAAVAAEALGLGTVYIGAMRNRPEDVAAELGLPPGVFALFGLCVGYPDPADGSAIKPRLPQPAVLHRETYQTSDEPAALAEYTAAMAAFYARQKMEVRGDWVDHSARRVAGPASLSGRDKLRAILGHLGFELK